MSDQTSVLQERVEAAFASSEPLWIRGGGTKSHLGRHTSMEPDCCLDTRAHHGVLDYTPTELVIRARAGTPLREIQALLAEHGQMLPFEPPSFGEEATLGGTIACGLSGPARFARGAARDFVLGSSLINGRGEAMNFGGQVMKNVAGYDVSRLMVGAFGTLGVLLDVSLKVLPRPACERTWVQRISSEAALVEMARLQRQPLPLTGAAWVDGVMYLRASGAEPAVASAGRVLGGDALEAQAAGDFWARLSDQRLSFFSARRRLWRLSLPPASPVFSIPGETLIDWGGAQRWLKSTAEPEAVFAAANGVGGHATLYFDPDNAGQSFSPLSAELMKWHRQLKSAFDPECILNPGRQYVEL